jgi:hypothetical protein
MKLPSAPRDGRLGSQLVGKGWLIGVKSLFGQVAEWLKAVARKGCYATQFASEVRILPLSAKPSD